MKTQPRNFILTLIAGIALFASSGFNSASAAAASNLKIDELQIYETLAKQVLLELNRGKLTNIDKLIAIQVKMVNLGSNACREYELRNPAESKLMNLVYSNAENMQKMSLQEIQKKWHKNTFLMEQGIGADKLVPSSITKSLMSTVVHPATATIALNQYKQTSDDKYLGQARRELMKSLDHLKYIQ